MGEITDRVSELEARQEKLELDLVEARMILRDQVGTAFETVPECAREAARLLEALRDDRARSPDYARTLQHIDKMLKDAFPGDTATITARVAAACENTKSLREAQTRIEGIERDNKTLSDELDRVRRAHAETNKKLLNAKKDVEVYREARADEAEEKLRRKSHETVPDPDIQGAANQMRQIRKIADDRGSFWVQGVRYVPDCRTEVNADAVAKLEKIAQMLEAFKK